MEIKMTNLYAHFCHCQILDRLFVPKCSTDIHGLCHISTKDEERTETVSRLRSGRSGVSSQVVRSGSVAHLASVLMVTGVFGLRQESSMSTNSTTRLHLVLRLRVGGATLHGGEGQFYLYLYLYRDHDYYQTFCVFR
jgi:hypothetical protein